MERLGRIIFGLILFLVFLFLAVSLLSPSSFYIPDRLQLESEGAGRNYCGNFGIQVSFLFLDLFGAGAFFLLIPMIDIIFSYWFGWREDSPCLITLGAFFLLTGICGGAACWEGDYSFGPVLAGAGGYYGELIRFYLTDAFAPLGVWFFLGGIFLAGIVLYCPVRLIYYILALLGIYALADIIFLQIQKVHVFLFKRKKSPQVNLVPDFSEFNDVKNELIDQNSFDSKERSKREALSDSTADFSENDPKFEEADAVGTDSLDSSGRTEENGEVIPAGANTEDSDWTISDGRTSQTVSTEGTGQPISSEEELPKDYQYPDIEYLKEESACDEEKIRAKIEKIAQELEKAFLDFGYEVHVVETHIGPVITMYEISLPRGTRLNKIQPLANDLQRALKSKVRIVAPLPDKDTVGVEVPNPDRQIVRLRNLIEESRDLIDKMALPIFLGKNVSGVPIVNDLAKLPHLLIAGRTGTGKSVCLNAIIMSLLMTKTPFQVKMILIDPKMVELILYKNIPHLMHPVVTDMKKAEAILSWTVQKMEDRYLILSRASVRNLEEYNHLEIEELYQRIQPESEEEWKAIPKTMPYIVVIADEMADLMMTSGKEVEQHIIRLAQKSRAVGIHLVLATQKPTVDVVTGLIKSNLPARIAFGVASRTDSQVVLDCTGAERLLGNGDMLLLTPGTSDVVRGQGTFVSEQEINKVTKSIGGGQQFEVVLPDIEEEGDLSGTDLIGDERDALYDQIIESLFQDGGGSVSSIQRKFRIGYPRAGRIFDCLEREGIISKANPIKRSLPRDMLITYDEWKLRKENEKNGSNKKEESDKRYPLMNSNRPNSSFLPPDLESEEKKPFYNAFKNESVSSDNRRNRETDQENNRKQDFSRPYLTEGGVKNSPLSSAKNPSDAEEEFEDYYKENIGDEQFSKPSQPKKEINRNDNSDENSEVWSDRTEDGTDGGSDEEFDGSEGVEEEYADELEDGADGGTDEEFDESEGAEEEYADEFENGADGGSDEEFNESEDAEEEYADELEDGADGGTDEEFDESEDAEEEYADEFEDGADGGSDEEFDESEDAENKKSEEGRGGWSDQQWEEYLNRKDDE